MFFQKRRRRFALQRLFSTFPGGLPGVGLLLLRSTIGFTAAVQGVLYLLDGCTGLAGAWVAAALLIPSGSSLLIGFLTPAVSILVALGNLGILLSWFPPPWNIFNAKLATALMMVTSLAVAFLGPGAFSLDSHLFGRREINIPKAPPTTKR